MLCDRCQNVFQEPAKCDDSGFSVEFKCEATLGAIRASAESCFCCHMAWRRLDFAVFDGSSDPALSLTFNLKSANAHGKIVLRLVATHTPSKRDFWMTALIEEESAPAKYLRTVTSDSTGSDETLHFLKERLAECQSSHQTCRHLIASGQGWYPTRLIEVTALGPRLIETAEDASLTGPYASLSHRWGGADIITCTKETLEELKAGISPSALTTAFLDALHAIEVLGIRYIWIDSLCIIQDSTEDWVREAKMMRKVYQYAFVNLSATRAEDSEIGLFASRNPDVMGSGPFHIDNGVLKGEFRAVEAALESDWGYWDREIQNAPLNSRGWVMQERLLSPRVVHFASEQVFWDCAELTASETLPTGAMAAPQPKSMWIDRKQSSNLFRVNPDDRGKSMIFGEWANIVNAYSNCHFTFTSDKLIALASIAEHLQGILGYDYYCGIWRYKIEVQLCWFVVRKGAPCTRADIAPSWSWASLDGLVETPSSHCYSPDFPINLLANVTDIAVQERQGKGYDRGGAYAGEITIRGFLNRVGVESLHDDGRDSCICARLTGSGQEYAKQVDVDTRDVIGADGLFFIPMFETRSWHLMKRSCSYSEVRGLLLRVVDKTSGIFERCGHVKLFASSFPTGNFNQSWLDLLSAEGKEHLPCIEYSSEVGHLIKVV